MSVVVQSMPFFLKKPRATDGRWYPFVLVHTDRDENETWASGDEGMAFFFTCLRTRREVEQDPGLPNGVIGTAMIEGRRYHVYVSMPPEIQRRMRT